MYRYITDELPQNISCFSINEITRNNDLKVISLHSHHKPILIYISSVQKFSLKGGMKISRKIFSCLYRHYFSLAENLQKTEDGKKFT